MNKTGRQIVPSKEELPKKLQQSVIMQREYLCNGKLVPFDGPFEKVYSPIQLQTESEEEPLFIGEYPLLSEKESLTVLDAAVRAYDNGKGAWPTTTVTNRINAVLHFAAEIKQQRETVVNMLMLEICKSRKDAEKEFDRTVEYIIDTVEAFKELDRTSSRFVIEKGILAQIRRAPLGVVLCMGPFNYPLNETFTTLIPAILMGNTVIFKPPKIGVLLHSPLLKAFQASFPAGVVNTIYGEGEKVVAPLMRSGKIDVLAFIGSSRVADILKQQHPAPHRLRSVLGLEAKNAGIVLQDADIDSTAQECVLGALSFNGQRCTALKILFVHQDIVSDFINSFVKKVQMLSLGMPWDAEVNITPLPEPKKSEYLTQLIQDAVEKGARVMNDGGGMYHGTLFHPAVLYPVDHTMRIYHEEQFGPVVPIVPYNDITTPLSYVQSSAYGQQVSIFGRNADTIASLVDPLVNQVCRVNINSQCQRGPDSFPFTGRKDSAEGTLSVSDALRVFSIRTLVAAKMTENNKAIIAEIVRNRKSSFLSTDFIL